LRISPTSKSDVSAGAGDAVEFGKDGVDEGVPGFEGAGGGDLVGDGGGVDVVEPAAEPVVGGILLNAAQPQPKRNVCGAPNPKIPNPKKIPNSKSQIPKKTSCLRRNHVAHFRHCLAARPEP